MVSEKILVKEIIFAGGHLDAFFQYLGALDEIFHEKVPIKLNIQRYIGSSSGAILAFLLNIGYSPNEVIRIMKRIDFSRFDQAPPRKYLHLFDDFGIQDTLFYQRIFNLFLQYKNIQPDCTFLELYEKTKKHLDVVTYCLNSRSVQILNYAYTPHLSVTKALCMSMAIPFIFKPVKHENKLYVDALLSCNFPIDVIKDYKHFLGFSMKTEHNYEENICFFKFLEIIFQSIDKEIAYLKEENFPKNHRIFKFQSKRKPRTHFHISPQDIENHLSIGKTQIYNLSLNCQKHENKT